MRVISIVLLISLAAAEISEDVPAVKFSMVDPQLDLLNVTKSSIGRIINGNQAPPNNFPYQVGLEIILSNGYTWCGGAIISEYYVLTAAHCVDKATAVNVFFGAHDRTNFYEITQSRIYVSKSYIKVHEDWSTSTLRNDIALIRIPTKIQYSRYVQPVAIPTRALENNPLEGAPAIATGWGYTAGTTTLSRYLQFVDVLIQEQSVCVGFLKPWVQPSNICIDGSNSKGACYGDSGSPLVTTNGMKFIVGVASFIGYYGCEANWPSVYTRVSSYLDWISWNTGLVIY